MMNHLESASGAPPSALHDFDIRVRRFRPHVLVAEDDEDLRVLLQCWLDADGYQGWVSAEYTPKGATAQGLGWLPPV